MPKTEYSRRFKFTWIRGPSFEIEEHIAYYSSRAQALVAFDVWRKERVRRRGTPHFHCDMATNQGWTHVQETNGLSDDDLLVPVVKRARRNRTETDLNKSET